MSRPTCCCSPRSARSARWTPTAAIWLRSEPFAQAPSSRHDRRGRALGRLHAGGRPRRLHDRPSRRGGALVLPPPDAAGSAWGQPRRRAHASPPDAKAAAHALPGESERLIDAATGTHLARCATVRSSSSCTARACACPRRSVSPARRSISTRESCACSAKAARSGSCRSAGRQPRRCAATWRSDARISTGGTVPTCSSTPAAARSRAQARS